MNFFGCFSPRCAIAPPAPPSPTALRDEDWLREVAKEWMGNHFSNTLSRLELRRAKSKLIVDFESKHISRALKIISITKIWTDRFQYPPPVSPFFFSNSLWAIWIFKLAAYLWGKWSFLEPCLAVFAGIGSLSKSFWRQQITIEFVDLVYLVSSIILTNWWWLLWQILGWFLSQFLWWFLWYFFW